MHLQIGATTTIFLQYFGVPYLLPFSKIFMEEKKASQIHFFTYIPINSKNQNISYVPTPSTSFISFNKFHIFAFLMILSVLVRFQHKIFFQNFLHISFCLLLSIHIKTINNSYFIPRCGKNILLCKTIVF